VLAPPGLVELAQTMYVVLFGLTCMSRTAVCMTDLGNSFLIEPFGEFMDKVRCPSYPG
jgi:hypothetical protein